MISKQLNSDHRFITWITPNCNCKAYLWGVGFSPTRGSLQEN